LPPLFLGNAEMIRAETRLIEALVALKNNPYWQEVLKWMEDSLKEQREANDVMSDDVKLRQGQGRAQELNEILKAAEGAVKVHQKMKL
jgi:hypothetical protein